MKSVLISINPKWCAKIASGEKTVELRKNRPKIDTPFKAYIYETKGKQEYFSQPMPIPYYEGRGKVIGEFVCDRIQVVLQCNSGWVKEHACISQGEFFIYLGIPLGTHFGYEKKAYGWHISDLVIYDKAKELREFYTECEMDCEYCEMWGRIRVNADEFDMDCKSNWFNHKPLTRPPQSWCYVEGSET